MINLNDYLKKDQERAIRFNDYYEYYGHLANFELAKGNYYKAEQCMRHATTMVVELRRLHGNKKTDETVQDLTNKMIQQRKDWF